MLNQPLKVMLAMGVVAVLAASFLSHKTQGSAVATSTPAAVPQLASKAPAGDVSRSWYSSWFKGMSFRSSEKPARVPAPVVARAPSSSAQASGYGSVMIAAGKGGQYNSPVEIDGQSIPMLIDTGASVVALSAKDARQLGISPMPSDYTVKIATANGSTTAARTVIREIRLENILVRDVAAVVMPEGALHKSLLGMSFLNKLKRFEVASGKLILQP